jgi:hypothetical protein
MKYIFKFIDKLPESDNYIVAFCSEAHWEKYHTVDQYDLDDDFFALTEEFNEQNLDSFSVVELMEAVYEIVPNESMSLTEQEVKQKLIDFGFVFKE